LHPGLLFQHHRFGLDHQHRRRLVLKTADLRGAARLATQATTGLADLVEAMHERIARMPWSGPPGGANAGPAGKTAGKTTGITGLVYRSVRGVTRLVGGSLDALLGLLPQSLGAVDAVNDPHHEREAIVAALNGVLGDHLAATHNPLATTMALRQNGRPLLLTGAARGQVLVLIHGLCMNDLQWQHNGHDHGQALAQALGFTPVYLHYNSGLPIADNGQALSQLLQQTVDAWPVKVQRLVLLGHSMGGLLARSALRQAPAAGHTWPQHCTELLCLGTPHHGAPLERAGHWVDIALSATPYARPLARLGQLRSAGITDLRHGRVVAANAPRTQNTPLHVPLPPSTHIKSYALAGTTGEKTGDLKDKLWGDGLVPLASALGQHKSAARSLAFAPERQWVGHGVNHMRLLSDPGAFEQMRRWLA
jgi:pimeloyl-ACP methyl ester carboxylesterase